MPKPVDASLTELRDTLKEGRLLLSKGGTVDISASMKWISHTQSLLRVLDPYGAIYTYGSPYSLWLATVETSGRGPLSTDPDLLFRVGLHALTAIMTGEPELARRGRTSMNWNQAKSEMQTKLTEQLKKGKQLLASPRFDLSSATRWTAETEVFIRVLDPYGSCITNGTAYQLWDAAQWYRGNHPKTDLQTMHVFEQRLATLEAILSCDPAIATPEPKEAEVESDRGREGIQYSEFVRRVESLIKRAMLEDFPRSWVEDDITRRILRAFRHELGRIRIDDLNQPIVVQWDAYKLTKKMGLEQRYGDIGVLVRTRTGTGDTIEGVGFLEAKRRDRTQGVYDALKTEQIRRIRANAPHAFVLLYDFAAISEHTDNIHAALSLQTEATRSHASQRTHALVVPAGAVEALRTNTTSLNAFGIPLSFQLCARYLRGFDLDFSAAACSSIKGYADTLAGVEFLLVMTSQPVGATPTPDGEQGVNTALYSLLQ